MIRNGILFPKLVNLAQVGQHVINCDCGRDHCTIKEVNFKKGYVVLDCGRTYNIGYSGNLSPRTLGEPVPSPEPTARDVLSRMAEGRRLDGRGDYGLG